MSTEDNKNLTDSDIRPDELYSQWLEIFHKEVTQLISNKDNMVEVNCPACSSSKREAVFSKFGLQYHSCDNCGTVYVSSRPSSGSLNDFYNKSQACKFWKDSILGKTQGQRQRASWQPLYDWVTQITKTYYPKLNKIIDYKPKYNSLFSVFSNIDAEQINLVDPFLIDLVQDNKNKVVSELEQVVGKADIMTAFNVLDREFSPQEFIKQSADKLETGGLLFLTTNTISGFEYLILGENSSRLVPPTDLI